MRASPAAARPAGPVQRVGLDAVQPGAQVRALLEGPEARECLRERLLYEIVGEPVRWLGGITHL
jgi:hypothetical protein